MLMHKEVSFAEMQFLLQFLCRDFLAPTHPKSLMRNKRNPDPAEQNLFFGICKLAKGIQPTQKLKTDQTKKIKESLAQKLPRPPSPWLLDKPLHLYALRTLARQCEWKPLKILLHFEIPTETADWEAATFAAIDGQQLWVSETWHKVNFGFKSIHYKFALILHYRWYWISVFFHFAI